MLILIAQEQDFQNRHKTSAVYKSLNPVQHYLNEILHNTGYTPNALAKCLHTSPSTIRRIKSGFIHHTKPALFSRVLSFYCKLETSTMKQRF